MNVTNIKNNINTITSSVVTKTTAEQLAQKAKEFKVSPSKLTGFVTSLGKTGAILPVVLLEGTVTGGRTYQADKRDGFVEARERFTEETLGAVFWLFGATMFGKLFDVIGKKGFKLAKEHYDMGHDAVRNPLNNLMLENKGNPKYTKGVLANSKLTKIAASLVAACAFIGFVVPKMNQAITRKFFANKIEPEKKLDARNERMYKHFHHNNININSVQNFKSAVSFKADSPQKAMPLSFKGTGEFAARMAQNFEQNAIYKLLGTDVGTVSGRAYNARNNDERVEILFRDLSSIYFYCFSTGAILSFLNGKDVFGGKNTNIDPNSALKTHNALIEKMQSLQKSEMTTGEFKKFALGNENYDKALYEKIFPQQAAPAEKKYFFGLIKRKPKPVYRVINLEEYNKIIDSNIKDSAQISKLKDLGLRMSGLQPELRVAVDNSIKLQKVLTESQVKDILIGGEARNPEFMKELLSDVFKESELPDFLKKIFKVKPKADRLTDPYTYIPQSQIEETRSKVLKYVESIIEHTEKIAKKNGNSDDAVKVTWEGMKKTFKRNLNYNGLYWGVAMGVSALFLSTIIPKVQYWITKMRTGRDGFPGIENLRAQQSEQNKAKEKV